VGQVFAKASAFRRISEQRQSLVPGFPNSAERLSPQARNAGVSNSSARPVPFRARFIVRLRALSCSRYARREVAEQGREGGTILPRRNSFDQVGGLFGGQHQESLPRQTVHAADNNPLVFPMPSAKKRTHSAPAKVLNGTTNLRIRGAGEMPACVVVLDGLRRGPNSSPEHSNQRR